jgi:hypothetical protein
MRPIHNTVQSQILFAEVKAYYSVFQRVYLFLRTAYRQWQRPSDIGAVGSNPTRGVVVLGLLICFCCPVCK